MLWKQEYFVVLCSLRREFFRNLLGHLYGAKTTPHMFIIDRQGMLIYDGAVDDRPTTDVSDVNGATNYISLTLNEAMSGKAVTTPTTRPYGCSVKYAH